MGSFERPVSTTVGISAVVCFGDLFFALASSCLALPCNQQLNLEEKNQLCSINTRNYCCSLNLPESQLLKRKRNIHGNIKKAISCEYETAKLLDKHPLHPSQPLNRPFRKTPNQTISSPLTHPQQHPPQHPPTSSSHTNPPHSHKPSTSSQPPPS
jgi:hypothetical protein